jgi:DNA-directed RNA polymerase specialized sigma24 family protein
MTDFELSLTAALDALEGFPDEGYEHEEEYIPHYERSQERRFHRSISIALNDIDDQTGLDVAEWTEDVRRYIIKMFSGRLTAADVEIEDAIQEVLLGLEIRNRGICPWRPNGGRTKAAYVFMVTEGVVRNMARKRLHHTQGFIRTLRPHMMFGMGSLEELEPKSWWKEEDDHQQWVEQTPARTRLDMNLVDDLARACRELPDAHTYVQHMVEGGKRYELKGVMTTRALRAARRTVLDFLSPD